MIIVFSYFWPFLDFIFFNLEKVQKNVSEFDMLCAMQCTIYCDIFYFIRIFIITFMIENRSFL